MKLRTDYEQMIDDLIERFGSATKAIEQTEIPRTTFYDIKRGVVKVPNLDTYIKMMEGLEDD